MFFKCILSLIAHFLQTGILRRSLWDFINVRKIVEHFSWLSAYNKFFQIKIKVLILSFLQIFDIFQIELFFFEEIKIAFRSLVDFFGSWKSVTKGPVDVILFNTWCTVRCVLKLFTAVVFVKVIFFFKWRVLFIRWKIVLFKRREASIIFTACKSIGRGSACGSWGFELIAYSASVCMNWLIFDSF